MNEETTETKAAEAPTDEELHKELQAALEAQGGDEGDKAEPAQETPPADEGEKEEAAKAEPEAPKIDDALMERAVKAGLSLADARSFASPETLERICTALEAKGKATGDGNPAGEEKKGGEEAFDPKSIPELSSDDFDGDLAAAFNGLRKLAIQQGETIKALMESAEKRDAKEAEEAKAKAEAEKAAALEKRKSLRLAAPGGVPGKTKPTLTGEEAEMAELVETLNRKFGG